MQTCHATHQNKACVILQKSVTTALVEKKKRKKGSSLLSFTHFLRIEAFSLSHCMRQVHMHLAKSHRQRQKKTSRRLHQWPKGRWNWPWKFMYGSFDSQKIDGVLVGNWCISHNPVSYVWIFIALELLSFGKWIKYFNHISWHFLVFLEVFWYGFVGKLELGRWCCSWGCWLLF